MLTRPNTNLNLIYIRATYIDLLASPRMEERRGQPLHYCKSNSYPAACPVIRVRITASSRYGSLTAKASSDLIAGFMHFHGKA